MFLGIICPMGMVSVTEKAHDGCTGEQVFGFSNPSQMGDCMNGKLSFLGNFLVSMPESLMFLVMLAFVLAFVFQFRLLREALVELVPRSRWRSLYLEYFSEIRVKFLKSFFFWLALVSRPALVA